MVDRHIGSDEGPRRPPPPHPYSLGREDHWKGWALKLVYINFQCTWFFRRLDIMILIRAMFWKGWALVMDIARIKIIRSCAILQQVH
jgi:hypothetical protein